MRKMVDDESQYGFRVSDCGSSQVRLMIRRFGNCDSATLFHRCAGCSGNLSILGASNDLCFRLAGGINRSTWTPYRRSGRTRVPVFASLPPPFSESFVAARCPFSRSGNQRFSSLGRRRSPTHQPDLARGWKATRPTGSRSPPLEVRSDMAVQTGSGTSSTILRQSAQNRATPPARTTCSRQACPGFMRLAM